MAEVVSQAGLLQGGWRSLPFEPFRDGVEIHWLVTGTPGVALLRYQPGASVPRHRHEGLETIVVLEGEQEDKRGVYGTGCLVRNPAGSEHAVRSGPGCVVLINWEKPVTFI